MAEVLGERIGERLRALREAGLYTRRELAERSGVAASTIEGLEMGLSARPRRSTIEKLAKALGVEAEAIMYGTEDRSDAPFGGAPPSQRSREDGLVEERRNQEAPSIADDKRWLAMQHRRGTLTRLEIAGSSVDPEDLPDEIAAFLAQDLRQLFQTADIGKGDRIESTVRIHLDTGEEIVMSARRKVA